MFTASSHAATVSGESTTYLQASEASDKNTFIPLYEYLNLSVTDIGERKMSLYLGGWASADLADKSYGEAFNSDLQYGYLALQKDNGSKMLNIGRVLVFDGVAAEKVDGIYARSEKRNYGLSFFAGSPVETGSGGDMIYGSRLSRKIPDLYTIGISYLREKNGSAELREEAGMDIWLHPAQKVELMGKSNYNSHTSGWMDNSYYLSLGPFRNLRLNTEASWINYKDYFAYATTDVFMLKTGILDPKEKVAVLGEEASYSINENMAVSADFKNYNYELAGGANNYGLKFSLAVSESSGAGFSIHRMSGDTDRLRYSEYRVYGFKKIGKRDISFDLLDISYDNRINGVGNAYSASLGAGCEISDKMRWAADIDYSHNPDFDKDVRAFVKFIYRFSSGERG